MAKQDNPARRATPIERLDLACAAIAAVDLQCQQRGIEPHFEKAEILYLALQAECDQTQRERYGISGRKA